MSSDLATEPDTEETQPKKAPADILKSEIHEGMEAIARPIPSLFVSGLSAGLDVGFSVLLMGVMTSAAHGKLPAPIVQILTAIMYSVGFIFVVVGRSELFTEQTTLAVLPVLSGKAPFSSLIRLWSVVYIANLIGATVFAFGIARIIPALGTATPEAFGTIAKRMLDHSAFVIFMSAILAGWLMGLLSWLVAAVRDTISEIVLVWIITTCIGFAGLHHVILGTVEVMAGAFSHQGIHSEDIFRFIFCATIGNILGGSFFVAIIKYGHSRT